MGYVEDLRRLVGHRPLILVGAIVVIFNEQKQMLLQQRTFPEGVWGLPGGLMELGESTEDAAKREVFEETNLQVKNLELIDVYSGEEFFTVAKNGDEFYSVTAAYYTGDYEGHVIANEEESYQCQFFSEDQLPENMIGSHRKMIQDVLKKVK
ncbi:DNA mismatch repair protein MutT [Halobacillus andaensis]|uniref:DNA mismatch repair protein MutT n=1 Tax=Halobacillus andaensis TaxID=1176239 RepID=A0A917B5F1_HALAA|nr:NUDIX hydrolase [Halobacillus andaensis]MBP2005884.1 8-oxo-dGTP pyrophosphatase MutT (NUDIX family) [Halobacillus andaensis]GGF25352.1 DNA mismatch repair protein MutT [Halobacillus andaensis]